MKAAAAGGVAARSGARLGPFAGDGAKKRATSERTTVKTPCPARVDRPMPRGGRRAGPRERVADRCVQAYRPDRSRRRVGAPETRGGWPDGSAGRSETPTGLPENPTRADGTSGWAIRNTALSARKCEELSGFPGRCARKKRRARRKFGLISWKFRELWPSWREIARAFPSFALWIPGPLSGCRRCRA